MKHKVFLFVLACAAAVSVFPASLEDLVTPVQAASLRDGKSVSQVQLKKPRPALMPAHGEVRRLVGEIERNLGPGILAETLFLYKKQGAGTSWTPEERRGLFNEALAISSLAGIQYYSASRGTMRTFYETSFVIDGPETKRPLPDPAYADVLSGLVLYARQKDLTFGDNIYRYEYRVTDDLLVFTQENLTAMNVGIITAVGKNRLRSIVAVIDAGDSLLIYAASMAKASALPGMGERIGNSFTNRTAAILDWFRGRADRIFKPA
jgi:hypothetical protein